MDSGTSTTIHLCKFGSSSTACCTSTYYNEYQTTTYVDNYYEHEYKYVTSTQGEVEDEVEFVKVYCYFLTLLHKLWQGSVFSFKLNLMIRVRSPP